MKSLTGCKEFRAFIQTLIQEFVSRLMDRIILSINLIIPLYTLASTSCTKEQTAPAEYTQNITLVASTNKPI